MQTLVIGCGYIGLPLALRLMERGDKVTAWVHSEESATELKAHPFTQIITGSVGDPAVWKQVPERFDLAVHCASTNRGGPEVYEEVFLKGGALLHEHQPQARRLMISSTSVYGQTQGEIVTEETPAEPMSATGRILAKAEAEALQAGALIARSSGIYGPGRGVLFEKFKRGEAVIEGDGSRWLNMIHRDDSIAVLLHLAEKGQPGSVYNVSDNTPVTLIDFYQWCSEFLGKPMPPHGSTDPNRKRGLTSKRVSNTKLRETGWSPKYPSFREGLAADHSPK